MFDSKIYMIIIIAFSSYYLHSQENKTLPMDKMTKSVVYIEGEKVKIEKMNNVEYEIGIRSLGKKEFQPLTERITGTGFFVRNGDYLFLVTAQHVAKNLMSNVKLIAADSSGNSTSYLLDKNTIWIYSENADIAITHIVNPLIKNTFNDSAIDFSFLPTSETSPVPELSLIVVGFPLGLGVQNKFSPLRRETNAASGLIDLKRFDIDKITTFFLLQDPSIGGYSGAPVFVLKTYKFGNTLMNSVDVDMCIGIIHGTYSDNTGGKLGLVTPTDKLYKLIYSYSNK
ncbi:MAG: serine protease [Candidatus Delongbacteria bacterium]|nr:serine protease [Candidatus Delongbacteria bacterium]MCG2761188.1 serine protease [Candidatus Delongbacteria bacterium]